MGCTLVTIRSKLSAKIEHLCDSGRLHGCLIYNKQELGHVATFPVALPEPDHRSFDKVAPTLDG